ncbi:hypothetical protein CFter6_2539 [Collimonas fungivorans]|uniref:Uncharacterized protein n=1 Tax=Collimonas fungivorans TaxID=158899 RepID=A0A127PCM9_9BURK|nr:hypothetical protein CFter6_2539 [Collimonas fungivorans]
MQSTVNPGRLRYNASHALNAAKRTVFPASARHDLSEAF